MRLAFVLLVATNIAVLLWGLFVRTPLPSPSTPPGGDLRLIDEGAAALRGTNPNSIVVGVLDRPAEAKDAHLRASELGLAAHRRPTGDDRGLTTPDLTAPDGSRWVSAVCPPPRG